MKTLRPLLVRAVVATLALACATAAGAATPPQGEVDPWIFGRLGRAPGERVGVLVELADRADLSAISGTKGQKGWAVYGALTAAAARTQGPLLARLAELGVPHRAFWIANVVWVEADAALVDELAQRPDVRRVVGDSPIRVPETLQPEDVVTPSAPTAVEWNIQQVNADDVWALGFTGQGVVVGRPGHRLPVGPSRRCRRSTAAGTAPSPTTTTTGTTPSTPAAASAAPTRRCPATTTSHGTHTMGTMVGRRRRFQPGRNGARGQVDRLSQHGPGQRHALDLHRVLPVVPRADRSRPDRTPIRRKAPDVINNSWSCPTSEGCNSGNWATMQAVVESLRAAGIVVVVSAGNGGSTNPEPYPDGGCETVRTPAAIFDASFSVGNTNSSRHDLQQLEPRPGHRRRLEPDEARHFGAR